MTLVLHRCRAERPEDSDGRHGAIPLKLGLVNLFGVNLNFFRVRPELSSLVIAPKPVAEKSPGLDWCLKSKICSSRWRCIYWAVDGD